MKLYAHDLRGIAMALESLEKASGVKVTTFEYHALTVTVDETDSKLDGRSLYVTEIRETVQPNTSWMTPTHRDTSWAGQRDS